MQGEGNNMKLVELECPMCGNQCKGKILQGYPDYVTISCIIDGFHARKLKRNSGNKALNKNA